MDKNFIYQSPERPEISLDPRSKILFMLLTVILIFLVYDKTVLNSVMVLIPILLLYFNGLKPESMIFGVMFLIACFTKLTIRREDLSYISFIFLGFFSEIVFRFFPAVILGYYIINTTKPGEFISGMSLMHFPEEIIIPAAMIFRFFPAFAQENKAISIAMKMKGLSFGSGKFWRHPLRMLEYRLSSLIRTFGKVGDELYTAALGIGDLENRSCMVKLKFGKYDAWIGIISIILIFWTALERL